MPPIDLLTIGGWAELHHGEEITERAWTYALQAEDEPVRAAGAVSLGVLWANRGEHERAVAVLEPANTGLLTELGQAIAAFTLGLLYDLGKDIERARSHQQAIDRDYWQASPQVLHNLELLLGKLGDADGAEVAFTRAIEARLNPYKASAMHALALTGCKTEPIAEAIWRYARLAVPKRRSIRWPSINGCSDACPGVTCELGQWLQYRDEPALAVALPDQAMTT